MQAQAARDRVEQVVVVDLDGDDVGDVELEEVDAAEDAAGARVANADEDEEWNGDEVEGGGHEGRVATRVGTSHDETRCLQRDGQRCGPTTSALVRKRPATGSGDAVDVKLRTSSAASARLPNSEFYTITSPPWEKGR